MRGAVSLAAALALPADFPARDQLLFITFGVIFATLVLQGLTLPAVIRWSGVHDDGAEAREELLARRRATEAALERLDELEGEEWTRDDTVERMRGLYRYRRRRLTRAPARRRRGRRRLRAPLAQVPEDGPHRARRAARARSSSCATPGEISNDVMHRIERELDLEDERLEI